VASYIRHLSRGTTLADVAGAGITALGEEGTIDPLLSDELDTPICHL
jgi:hypothetical protein